MSLNPESPALLKVAQNTGLSERIGKSILGRIAAVGLLTAGLSVAAETYDTIPAHATTVFSNDYPNLNMPCEHSPYNTTGSCANYDWGPTHTEAYNDPSENSSRGYGYRNCTDGVAYWVKEYTGVNIAGWGNAKNWNTAASRYTVYAGNTNNIEPGDIAQDDTGSYGHVGFVTDVNKNTDGSVASITVAEMNKDAQGDYSHDTYTSRNSAGNFIRSSAGATWDHFIDVNGSNNGLNNEALSNGGSGPSSSVKSNLGAVAASGGQQDVFWRGGDNNLYEAYWDGSAWHKYNLGFGDVYSAPTVAIQPSSGYIEVFWQGPNNNLYQAVWNGGSWVGNWNLNVGSTVYSQPTAAAYGSQVDVFWKDNNGKLKEAVWNGSAWVGFDLGSNFWNISSAPGASDLPSGQNDVYWQDTGGNLIQAVWNGSSWASFALPVGSINSQPSATYEPATGYQDVFWRDSNNNLQQALWTGSSWAQFNIGMGNVANAPAATAWGNQVDAFWTDSNGNLEEAVWNGGAWVNFQIPGMGPIPSS